MKKHTNVYFLGGLEEVGKNCYCIEHDDEILMFDCGIKMPGVTSYGFDHIIPDFTHVIKNMKKLVGVIITHGHEDHIGAIAYLAKNIRPIKIYAPRIAIEMILRKLKDGRIPKEDYEIIEVNDDFLLKTKHFTVESYNTVHSIPDTFGYFITTPNGIISSTADFRFDLTPLGPITDFNKLSRYSQKGCTLLLSDSTNSLVPGFTKSETMVMKNIDNIVSRNYNGRLIISAFSSNVFRLQEIVKIAIKYNKKIIIFGKSMERNIQISIKLKYIKIDHFKKVFVKSSEAKNIPPNKILIICTGSQGEPSSALDKMSRGEHPNIKLKKGDNIVFSSNTIPGNYLSVDLMVNKLKRIGVNVIKNTQDFALHTSGHATQNEQKLMFALLKPKYFIPMHGEYNMLVQHTKTAMSMGIKEENNFICKNGDVISLEDNRAFRGGKVKAGVIYIEGYNKISQSSEIINERMKLMNNGIISVIYTLNFDKNKLINKPLIISRGTFYVKENGKLIYQLQSLISSFINKALGEKSSDDNDKRKSYIERNIIDITSEFIYTRKKRHPFILPIELVENL